MKWHGRGYPLVLSRRNLEALLGKLDAVRDGGESRRMICGGPDADYLMVMAEENDEHYLDRPAGEMHPREEDHISKPATGVARSWMRGTSL